MLLGQGYRTPRGAVIDGYGAMLNGISKVFRKSYIVMIRVAELGRRFNFVHKQ
jgi:hypothetical protein